MQGHGAFGENHRDFLIRDYFLAGYTNLEICMLLCMIHEIFISVRTVKRSLQRLGLRRRQRNIDFGLVNQAIQNELDGSGRCLGYRAMTARLRSAYRLRIPRDTVMELLRQLDPARVALRQVERFSRRQYSNKGPNYLIHLDGYDKLKRYGFAIHGAIDGFSRKILWLAVGRTNNNPYVVASYFMDYIGEMKGVPRCIRMDRGTENTFMADIQMSMRWNHVDDMSGSRSVIYGSSHSNQRIERWWLTMRQSGIDHWINIMKDLESFGLLSTDNHLHIECLRYCFTEILQRELDQISIEWNDHRPLVRRSTDGGIAEKPNLLYLMPELYDAADYRKEVNEIDVQEIRAMCDNPRPSGCEEDFEIVCNSHLEQHGKSKPNTTDEALALYGWLVQQLA